jgi:hypothetical protein
MLWNNGIDNITSQHIQALDQTRRHGLVSRSNVLVLRAFPTAEVCDVSRTGN